MDQDVRIVHLVLREDVLYYFLVQVCQGFGTVQFYSTELRGRDADLRRITIQTNSHLLQLPSQLHALLLCLRCLQHHENHI